MTTTPPECSSTASNANRIAELENDIAQLKLRLEVEERRPPTRAQWEEQVRLCMERHSANAGLTGNGAGQPTKAIDKGTYWGPVPKSVYDKWSPQRQARFRARVPEAINRICNSTNAAAWNTVLFESEYRSIVQEFNLPGLVWGEHGRMQHSLEQARYTDASQKPRKRIEAVHNYVWIWLESHSSHGTKNDFIQFLLDAMRFIDPDVDD